MVPLSAGLRASLRVQPAKHPQPGSSVQQPAPLPPSTAASAATLGGPTSAAPQAAAAAGSAPVPSLFHHASTLLAGGWRRLGDLAHVAASPRQQQLEQRQAAPAADSLSITEAADLAAAAALCEAIYRAVDFGEAQAEVALARLQQQLPAAPCLGGLAWHMGVSHQQRYVVAEASDALIVAVLGVHPLLLFAGAGDGL